MTCLWVLFVCVLGECLKLFSGHAQVLLNWKVVSSRGSRKILPCKFLTVASPRSMVSMSLCSLPAEGSFVVACSPFTLPPWHLCCIAGEVLIFYAVIPLSSTLILPFNTLLLRFKKKNYNRIAHFCDHSLILGIEIQGLCVFYRLIVLSVLAFCYYSKYLR